MYRTDKSGTIVITSTGTKLSSKTVATSGSSSSSSSGSSSSSSSSGSSSSSLSSNSTVYVTKTGKKYHKKACGSGTYPKTTLKNAKSRGLTACTKCF